MENIPLEEEKTNSQNIINLNIEEKENNENKIIKNGENIPQEYNINIINNKKKNNDSNFENSSPNENQKNKNIENDNLNINKEIKMLKKKEKAKEAKKNIEEVKKYLNNNVKDPNYLEVINNKPETLFEYLQESTIMKWEIKLFNNFSYTKTTTDEMILSVEKNTSFQTVIRNDAVRTRVRESILVDNFKETLENMITYYCKAKNVYYKQGLNEIFGPLILMRHKIKTLKLSKIFLWGDLFIDRFLPNYFYEKEFYALKSSLGLFVILLKYHEPSVFNRLDKMEILPEMYATNWLMTLMSGKVKLDLLFVLWDYIIDYDDPLFMHFILVSFLKSKRELIINCDKSLLPPLISNLTIFTKEELKEIIDKADEMRKNTPYSFRILANKLGFLIPKFEKLKEKYELYKPQSIPAMPILPKEIFYLTYETIIQCPDPDCDNEKGFKKIIKDGKIKYKLDFDLIENPDVDDYGEKMKSHICEKCNMNIQKKFDYFLIDLRILEYRLNKNEKVRDRTGFLPKMVNLEQKELKSEDLNDIIAEKYIEDRGKFHFIFLTTTTDTFSKFETNFYKDNISEQDKKKMFYGLMEQKKIDKELDLKAEELSSKEIYKLKEYDNLRKTLKAMQKQNYPYVSFVYGGFYQIHEQSFKLGIELDLHDKEKCSLCYQKTQNKNKNKKDEEKEKNSLYKLLWEHKKKIKYQNLTQYFKDPKISVCFGSLLEYKGKKLSQEKIQILIATLFSQFKIEIYKFDIKKQHITDNPSYYDLGINDDEQKDRDLIILEELKVSDIVGLNVDRKNKNILNFNIKVRHTKKKDDNKGKNMENIKLDSYNMIIDLSSSNDSKNFFRLFKNMSEEYKNHYKKKIENKQENYK